jgi:thymidine phosphorylase
LTAPPAVRSPASTAGGWPGAKLAGAPADPAAGIDLHVRIGHSVDAGQPLFTLHAESPGELAYAREYLDTHPGIVAVGDAP